MLTSGRECSQHLYILTWAPYKRNMYIHPIDVLPRDEQIAVSYARMTDCAMRMMPPLTTVGLMESLSANGRVVNREYAEQCSVIVYSYLAVCLMLE